MGYKLTKNAVQKTADTVKFVAGIPRNALANRSSGGQYHDQLFDAIITAATAINGNIRWKYTITIGAWDMSSSPSTGGTWVDIDTSTIYAFNILEDKNTWTSGTGTTGGGNTSVSQSDGTIAGSTCALGPLPVGGYVVVKYRGYDPDADQHYFTIINVTNPAQ